MRSSEKDSPISVSPIFIGEIAFFTGFVVLLRTGCLIAAALTTLPSLTLAVAMAWVLLRTLPSLVCVDSMLCATAS
jgi:hypothetical protein